MGKMKDMSNFDKDQNKPEHLQKSEYLWCQQIIGQPKHTDITSEWRLS